MVRIKIIRHSERLDYSHPIYWLFCFGQYWSDSPLTENGYQMAKIKGQKLAMDTTFRPVSIYTSPYTRTMSTGTEIQISFPYAKLVIEPLLAEYQPMYKHKINLYSNGIPTTYEGHETNFTYPESYENFSKRILFIIGKLIEKNDNDIIIITHGEILKTYVEHIQSIYPDRMLDLGATPYLTTLSFTYDKILDKIDENTIYIE